MKRFRILVSCIFGITLIFGGCWSKKVSELEARELATREFMRTCAKWGIPVADFSESERAFVKGPEYSFIWNNKQGGLPIVVTVDRTGWTEASQGTTRESAPFESR